jgi:hypothetical protein
MSKDISVDLVNAESTKVSSPMESSKVAFIAVPVKYGVGSLRELQIIVGAENNLVVGASSSAEGAEVEAKLETDKAHISGTAIVDGTINNRLEDRRISGGDSVGLHCTGGVVKRDHRKASHVQPTVMEVLIKIVLQTGNGGSGIEVHPQMIDVDIRR